MFVERPQDLSVSLSVTATFTCSVTGQPLPSIVWLSSQGEDLSENIVETTPDDDEFTITSVLRFMSASLDYIGTYTCSASNEDGNIEASAYLSVTGMLMLT